MAIYNYNSRVREVHYINSPNLGVPIGSLTCNILSNKIIHVNLCVDSLFFYVFFFYIP